MVHAGQRPRGARQDGDAIGFFKRALELKPDDEMAVINMANAYRNMGRDEEALVGYQRFLELDPKQRAGAIRGRRRS